MKKSTWIILALLLNTGLAVLFLFLYNDFQKLEKSEPTLPVPTEVIQKEEARDEHPLRELEKPKADTSVPIENFSGPPAAGISKAQEAAPATTPLPSPAKKSSPQPTQRAQTSEEISTDTATTSSSYEKIDVVKTTSAKTISRFPLVVGMLLVSSLFLNLALLLLYRSYATQSLLARKRQDFVSAVTHELRTPLTSIKMFGELLEDGLSLSEEKRHEYYTIINKESSRLSRLIDNILQLSSLEKKNYHPHLITEPLQDTLQSLIPELKHLAEKSGATFYHTIESEAPSVTFDREAIEQILFIFLENSLKFSAHSDEKNILLSLKSEGGHVILSWKDTGPGVDEAELKKIFEPFYRVENELTRKTKGTGIGLAMAKMLSDAMNIKLVAQNSNPGLTFYLIF